MKALIIYESVHHKNTEKIASAIARALKADLVNVEDANPDIVRTSDLVGFGSGIYFGRHHKSLFEFVEKMPAVKNKKAFIFSTSGTKVSRAVAENHKALREKLLEKGFVVVDEFSSPGHDTFGLLKWFGGVNRGRPNACDLDSAEQFARKIAKQYLSE